MDLLLRFLSETWTVLLDLAPWLLLGMFVAGILHVVLPRGFVHAHFGGRGVLDVVKACALGVPLPLCSCGVIPAAMGLKKDGASNGASTAFLISTPQTGVDSVMVCASFLGWPFALFKVASAFLMGLVGGVAVNAVERNHAPVVAPSVEESKTTGWKGGPVVELFRFGFGQLLRDIYRWVVIGVVVAGLLSTFIPKNFFANYDWMSGFGGMLVMLAISLPLYVCATASVPIAAALINLGLPMGSALVLLMAGPATNAATIGAVFKAFGRRVTGIYLGVVISLSLLLGWLFQSLVAGAAAAHHTGEGHEHNGAGVVALVSTWTLLALFGWFVASDVALALARRRAKQTTGDGAMNSVELKVEGMTCENCAAHVKRALEASAGVSGTEVDLDSGIAKASGAGLNATTLIAAVVEAGYKAAPVEDA